MDLEQSSGRTHHTIAVPSIFIVDQAGIVRWAHAALDYKVRPSNEQILAAIDALSSPLNSERVGRDARPQQGAAASLVVR